MAAMKCAGESGEKFTLFFGQESPFSQFYPAEFTIKGITYSCAEQYMMHQKAVEFKDPESAELILKAAEPRKMKGLGRQVADFDPAVWSKRAQDVVREGSSAKFSQNPHLLKELFATKGTTMAEASPRDLVWGIGLGQKNPKAHERRNWRGTNLLGNILTEVRDELMKNDGTVVMEEKKMDAAAVEKAASPAKSRGARAAEKTDKFVFFKDQDSPFSLFHPSEFTVDGVKYSCGEQYLMHQKALEFKDKVSAKKIMEETEPLKIKQVGHRISKVDMDMWMRQIKDVALKGNLAKFDQNKQLRKALFLTRGVEIAQASSDRLLGIGFGAKNGKANDRSKWTGKNILGDVLTQVREELMKTHLDEVEEMKEEDCKTE